MSSTGWDRLKELYEQATGLPPPQRGAFLERVGAEDPDVRSELEALLEAGGEAESFFQDLGRAVPPIPDPPPVRAARPGPAADTHADADGRARARGDPLIGTTIRQYRIESRLGAGGMGVVYRAHDTSLDRPVALKFLPPHVGVQEEAAERLLVEARAAAALDHPNVCAVHEIGETETGRRFLVMACYEGETLREKLARGPLPVEEAAEYARQIASALAAAHARGIVHRDVKPGNVLVTPEGVVKVLDFGLAKLSDVTMTGVGRTLGTVAYMAPEQLRGEPVDARTDLWALGVVWYEMLAGRRPFPGENTASVAHRIQHEEPPPVADLREDVPANVAGLLKRLLEKDPADRAGSAGTLLESLDGGSSIVPHAAGVRGSGEAVSRPVARRLAAALVLLVIPTSLGLLLSRVGSSSASGGERLARHLTDRGDVCSAAISPEGGRVAYVAGSSGDMQLWLRDVRSNDPPVALASLELSCATIPPRVRWGDSTTVWFTGVIKGKSGLHAVPAGGGAARRLHDRCTFDPSPDGRRVACLLDRGTGLVVADSSFRQVDTLPLPDFASLPLDPRDRDLAWSPSGEWLALNTAQTSGNADGIALVSPDGRGGRPLLQAADSIGSLAWSPDAETLYFVQALPSGTDLMKLDSISSQAQPRARVVQRLPRGTVAQLTAGRSGGPVAILFTRSWSRIMAVEVGPAREPRPAPMTDFGPWIGGITVTSDGASLVYYGEGPEGRDVYRMPVSGGEPVRLTSAGDIPYSHSMAAPAVSPDGSVVAYFAPRAGGFGLFLKHERSNRSALVEGIRLYEWGEIHWSEEGIYVQPESPNNLMRVELRLETAGGSADFSSGLLQFGPLVRAHVEPLVPSGELDGRDWFLRARAAPGGYPIALKSSTGIWLIRGPGSARERISLVSPNPMGWSEDGRYLFASNWSSDVRRYDTRTGEWTFLGSLPENYRSCTVSPDGTTVYCKELREDSDVVLVEDLDRLPDLDLEDGAWVPLLPDPDLSRS